MKIMGPNDARHVVWAIGEFFIYFFRVFLTLIDILSIYSCNIRSTRAGRYRTIRIGPNDAPGVVWALGEYIFFLFFDTNYTFVVYTGSGI